MKIQRIAVFSDVGKRDSQMMKMLPEPFANLAQQIGVLVGFQQTLGNLNPPLLLDVKFGHAYILVGKGGAVNAKPLFAAGAHSRVVGHIGIIHYWVANIPPRRPRICGNAGLGLRYNRGAVQKTMTIPDIFGVTQDGRKPAPPDLSRGIFGDIGFSPAGMHFAPAGIILSWSHGEVSVATVASPGTFKVKKGGLFCTDIFGKTKREHRENMGHIRLACPVNHALDRSNILRILPVLPAGLRLITVTDGEPVISGINELYLQVLTRNKRLKAMMGLDLPDDIVGDGKQLLQDAIDALMESLIKQAMDKAQENDGNFRAAHKEIRAMGMDISPE